MANFSVHFPSLNSSENSREYVPILPSISGIGVEGKFIFIGRFHARVSQSMIQSHKLSRNYTQFR